MEDVPQEVETDNNRSDNGRDASGRFLPGNPGRQPGTTRNKFRTEVKTLLRDKWPEFRQWLDTLKPNEKVRAYMELLPYGLGRLANATDAEDNSVQRVTIDYSKLSEGALKEVLSNTTISNDETGE